MNLFMPLEAIYKISYAPGIHSYPTMYVYYEPETGLHSSAIADVTFSLAIEKVLLHISLASQEVDLQKGNMTDASVYMPVAYLVVRNPVPRINFVRFGTIPLYWDPLTFHMVWWLKGVQVQATLGVPYMDVILLLPPLNDSYTPSADEGLISVWRFYASNIGFDIRNIAGIYDSPYFWWDLVNIGYTFDFLRKQTSLFAGVSIMGNNLAMIKPDSTDYFIVNGFKITFPGRIFLSFYHRYVTKDFQTYYGYWRYSAFLAEVYEKRFIALRLDDVYGLQKSTENSFIAQIETPYGWLSGGWVGLENDGTVLVEAFPNFSYKSVGLGLYARYVSSDFLLMPEISLRLPLFGTSLRYDVRVPFDTFSLQHRVRITADFFPLRFDLIAGYASPDVDDSGVDFNRVLSDTYWGESVFDDNWWKKDNFFFFRVRGGF